MTDKLKLKKIISASLLFIIFGFVFYASNALIKTEFLDLDDEIIKNIAFENRLKSINDEINSLAPLQNLSEIYPNDYALSLGNIAQATSSTLVKFQMGDIKTENSIDFLNVKLEISGAFLNINAFLNKIYEGEYVCIIKNISLRQNGELLWLARDNDNAKVLNWLDEGEKTEESKDINLTQLLNRDDMLCYLELEFMGE